MRPLSLMLFSTVALVAQAPAAADLAQKFNTELPGITQMLKELKANEALTKMQGLVPAQRPAFNASSAQAIGQSLDNAQGLMSLYRLWANVYSEAGLGEKAVEIDPAITTRSQIDVLAGLGFNRISMGVQDFDPKVQETVGRIQGEKETADLVAAARSNGFKGVNLDLIYGLPYQTPETWKRTLERILAIHPDRLAVFGFAYVPWVKPHQRLLPEAALPKTSERVALFFDAVRTFTGSGYRLIGLDHFALESDEMARAQDEGVLTRNFQGYTVRPADDTIAFGMTSISDLGGAYAQNAHRLKDWAEKVEAGILPVVKGASVNDDDVMRRHVINRVMCLLRLDLREVSGMFGAAARAEIEASMKPGLAELVSDGLVTFDGDVLKVTPVGQLLVRNVAMMFDAYLPRRAADKKQTFSRTV